MTKQIINIGTADKGNGDPLRTAFSKVNDNFTELYTALGLDTNGLNIGSFEFNGSVMTTTDSSPIVIDQQVSVTSDIAIGGNITIVNSVIGYSSSETISEETPGGTVSQTITEQSQIEIDATSIAIARRTILVSDDGVVTATDSAGSTLEVTNSGAFIKRYVEPDGPNNGSYFQISTSNGAILEGVNQTISGDSYGRVIATQGAVEITHSDGMINSGWSFAGTEITFGSDNGSYIIDGSSNNFEVRSGNNINLEADNEANIYTRYGDKQWTFNSNGDLILPDKFPINFIAVFDFDHYTGPGEFTGDGTASLTVELQGAGTNFEWAADDPVYETDLGYVGQQTFSFTAADHSITGYTLEITMELVDGGDGYVFNLVSMTEPPTVVNLAKIRSNDELIIKSGSKGWLFDVNGDIYLPPAGDIKDYLGNSVLTTIDGGNASTVF